MKIQTRIVCMLVLIACLFFGIFVLMEYNERKKMELLRQNEIEGYITLFERILELESLSLENFVFDYSSREQIVTMIEKGGAGSIDRLIRQGKTAFFVDVVWIFDTDFNLLYTTLENDAILLDSLELVEDGGWRLFMWRSFYRHFFTPSQNGLLEIRTAPVQLPEQREIDDTPKGFMFAGRLWHDAYLRHISSLTKSHISLLPPAEMSITHPHYDKERQAINFLKILHSWDKEPVMVADVVYNSPLIEEFTRISAAQFFTIIAFILTIIVFLTVSTLLWVSFPLRRLSQALYTENISPIEPLRNSPTEFGRFADIIINFFRQRNDLLESYAKIKQNEQQLKAYNQQISAQEEELKASNEELEANYQEILAREQELRGLNQQLSAQEQQLRAANTQLTESEDRYRQLIETMNDGLAIVDKEGCFTHVNESFCRMLGYAASELTGAKALDFVSDKSRQKVETAIKNQILTPPENTSSHEIAWIRKDGEKIYTLFSHPRPISDYQGAPTSCFSVITDITELKNSEKQLMEYKNFLERVIENSRDGIIIADHEGKAVLCNRSILDITGCSRADIIGKNDALAIGDNTLEDISSRMKTLFEKGYLTFDTAITNKHGQTVYLEISSNLIRDDAGNIQASVSIIRDVTQRKKMEKQFLEAEKLRSLGQLSGGVAHDLNNVLAAILGRVQILKRHLNSGKTGTAHDFFKEIDVIERASTDAAETVRRIQQFAKPRDSEPFFQVLNVNSLIEDSLQFTKTRWKEDANYRGLTYEIIKKLSPVADIEGNPSELREVFTNIIINAIDAMPHGGQLTLESAMEKDTVVVIISDIGKGIPEKLQDKIFEPFFTTKGPSASGLGTSVSYGIIDRHGGAITVKSRINKGTSFIIKLPKTDKPREEEKQPAVFESKGPRKILVIEDEEAVRDLLSDILTDAGHAVDTAPDGFKGIEKFQQNSFDLIFTDFGMPGISGIEVAKKIRQTDRSIPIVMITGWGLSVEMDKVDATDINKIVNKPFQVEDIIDTVEKLCTG